MARAGGLFGHVGEFNSERQTFKSNVERMEMNFTANDIVETPGEENEGANQLVKDRKRAIFLTEIGADVYSTLSNLLVSAKPKDTSLDNIVQALEMHLTQHRWRLLKVFILGHVVKKPVSQLVNM